MINDFDPPAGGSVGEHLGGETRPVTDGDREHTGVDEVEGLFPEPFFLDVVGFKTDVGVDPGRLDGGAEEVG